MVNTLTTYNTDEEKASFLHGYLYSKAEDLKKNGDFKNESINSLMKRILTCVLDNNSDKTTNYTTRNTFITVKGKDFRCDCGANVFSQTVSGVIECNGCQKLYSND